VRASAGASTSTTYADSLSLSPPPWVVSVAMGAARGSGLVTSPPSSADAHLHGAQLFSRHSEPPFGLGDQLLQLI